MGILDDYVRIKGASDIGYQVNGILEEHPDISDHLAKSKSKGDLSKKLEGIVEEKYREHEGMFNAAGWIDTINRWIVAPADIIGGAIGALGIPSGYVAGLVPRVITAIPKLIYSSYYTSVTGDPNTAAWSAGQEALAYGAPFGGAAYVAPVYSKQSQNYLRRVSADEFRKRYMGIDKNVVDLADYAVKKQKRGAGQGIEGMEAARRRKHAA